MKTWQDINSFADWSKEEKDRFSVNVIKGLVMDAVRNANSGHTGGALSSADFAYILFSEFLNFNPDDPDWITRDRFILSAGHESMLLYSLLYFCDWLTLHDLQRFRQLHSRTAGHPEVETPGVEATTGPLGQGVGMAVGMALAEVVLKQIFLSSAGDPEQLLGHYTYVLAGDGDLQEPVSLGAAALAGHWGLSRLIMFYDSNEVQISGPTARSDSTDVATVFRGLGWQVQTIEGHDHEAIRMAIKVARDSDSPSIIIGKTTMACGTASMEGSSATHGSPLPQEEIDKTKVKLGLKTEQFYVPVEVKTHFQNRFTDLRNSVKNWQDGVSQAREDDTFDTLWGQIIDGELPELELPAFPEGALATRKAFGKTLEKFAKQLPNIIGGSADLEPSNYTGGFARTYGDFQRNNLSGRNLTYGVREFPMATIVNGLSLHGGIIAFGGTFLVFADYERPAFRLAALQKILSIFEFTHDSFYVGEDGPTHQPVEQIMSLRLIPDFYVFRPADARETAVCFNMALSLKQSPSALLLTRQSVPVLPLEYDEIEAGVNKGAYNVLDCKEPAEIVLLATGSEVSLAMEVAERMGDKLIRVVSMPCWKIFNRQSKDYREALIPQRGCLKVSLEAGVSFGWERYIGQNGFSISLDRFGLSAPAGDLAHEFGFTAAQVEVKIRDYITGLL